MKHENALKTIGEVSSQIKVPVYVIRFWEKKLVISSQLRKKILRDTTPKNRLIF